MFPALLADRGLVAATEARLRRGEVTGFVRTDAPSGAGDLATPTVRYSPTAESAIYFYGPSGAAPRTRAITGLDRREWPE